jgi:tetratricopeptide (TPR) repeat protein
MLFVLKHIGGVILLCVCAIAVQGQGIDDMFHDTEALHEQPEMAMEIINRALEENPNSEELLKVRAEVYTILHQYERAIADYMRLTQLSPDEERHWYLLGQNQFFNGQLQVATRSE